MNIHLPETIRRRQRGVVAIEFALVGMFVFFPLVLMLVDAGRALFIYNTIQEVTRSAAREASIRWVDKGSVIKNIALFGGTSAPGAPEITTANITIDYLNATSDTPIASLPSSPGDNMSACADVGRANQCIDRVKVSVVGVTFKSLTGIADIAMPESTVILHAESMGFND